MTSNYGIYGSWTIEEAADVGKRFVAKCSGPRGMEDHLTTGKEYIVIVAPRIMPGTPLCEFIGDQGKLCAAHLERFEKVEAL